MSWACHVHGVRHQKAVEEKISDMKREAVCPCLMEKVGVVWSNKLAPFLYSCSGLQDKDHGAGPCDSPHLTSCAKSNTDEGVSYYWHNTTHKNKLMS